MSPLWTLYIRTGCHLCEHAEDLVAVYLPGCRLVDVDGDGRLQRAYGLRVPVLVRGDEVLLEGQIEESEVVRLTRRG
jgi:hypothetical protein